MKKYVTFVYKRAYNDSKNVSVKEITKGNIKKLFYLKFKVN